MVEAGAADEAVANGPGRRPADTGRHPLESFLDLLAGLDGWVIYGLLALLVFGESAAVVALLLPGEIALLGAGALAARGHASLPLVIAVAIVAAISGHAVGYEIGRRYGLSVLKRRLLRRYADGIDRTAALVARYGGPAVFLGRWTNVGRIVVPLLVGVGRMRYRTFAVFNILGGTAWVLTFVLLGSAAGASLDVVERTVGRASWWLTGLFAVALAVRWLWRRRAAGGAHAITQRRRGSRDRPCVGPETARCSVSAAHSSATGRDA